MAYAIENNEEFMLVAAIDFGTTFSGYAFSFTASEENPDLHEKIRTNKSWGADYGFQTYKVPTSVLTTRDGKFLAFGFEAEQMYGEAFQDEDEKPDMLLFRHFKMILHSRENVMKTSTIASLDGSIKPALDIFAHAIRYLKDHLIASIKLETGSEPSRSLIRWVITVPAIWSEESKQFMREAAFQAGCIESKDSRSLMIALEPEAASLCCRRLSVAKYADCEAIKFLPGMQYMVLDCGGGTCDITVHEIKSDNEIKEVIRASGGPWGGTEVDGNFIRLLEVVLGKTYMNTFQQKHPHEWSTFLIGFEQLKKNFKGKQESKISVTLPYIMASLYADMNGEKIEKKLRRSEGNGVRFANGMLIINHETATNLFDPVIQSIAHHVEKMLEISKIRKMRYIFMVGGFSESQLLQSAIKCRFQTNALQVLIPSETQLAIIKGAVLFGHRPEEISTRIAKLSYGCRIAKEFVNYLDEERRKVYYGGKPCCDVFHCLIQQNDEVETGVKKSFNFKPQYACQKDVHFEIYAKDGVPDTPVQYLDGEDMMKLGEMTLDIEGRGTGRSITFDMVCGGTELQIEAIDEISGNKANVVVDFLSKKN